MSRKPTENTAIQLINQIVEKSLNGFGPLSSAENLALEYEIDQSYPDDEERIESLINWETSKNFTSGFITGLGGILTIPVAVPASLAASWIIQARMAAAIARISGHDIYSDRVKTFIVLTLLGDACKDVLKDMGIKVGQGVAKSVLKKVPGKALIEINKKVGFRLLTKAGEKGVVNLAKMVPLAGGVIGGAFDAAACRIVGRQAKNLFYLPKAEK